MNVNILSFGEKKYTNRFYEFQNVEKADADFGDTASSVIRLAGADGGLEAFGHGRAPGLPGTVKVVFYLVADNIEDMTEQRDKVKAMKSWGRMRLICQPYDPLLHRRWCHATIKSIDMPQDADQGTDHLQPVTVTYSVPDPFWYAPGTECVWGEFVWGDGSIWGGAAGVTVVNGQDFTINYQGTAPTLVRITLRNDTANPVGSFTVQHIYNGQVIDKWEWYGTMVADDRLEVDPRQGKVLLNQNNAISLFAADTAEWMTLLPGDNTIRIQVIGTVTAFIRYMERFY